MIREFARARPRVALLGLLLAAAHAAASAYLKTAINAWYQDFYDLAQRAPDAPAEPLRRQVYALLFEFGMLVAPFTVFIPLAKMGKQYWVLSWRLSLVRSYLVRWNASSAAIEGASQRVHEDTQRFAQGILSCVSTILDSIFTLAAFMPVLYRLGASVRPPWCGQSEPPPPQFWLLVLTTIVALGGLAVSMHVGQPLVWLEMENQRVEAELRKQLVLLETGGGGKGAGLGGGESAGRGRAKEADESAESGAFHQSWLERFLPRAGGGVSSEAKLGINGTEELIATVDGPVLSALWLNYSRLYTRFLLLFGWLSVFDQAALLLPFVLIAPQLFAPSAAERISLGTLIATVSAFGTVFSSLNVVSESWADVNDWRVVVRRLAQFEAALDGSRDAELSPSISSFERSARDRAGLHPTLREQLASRFRPPRASRARRLWPEAWYTRL